MPWTLLRTTQFHEFAGQVLGQARIGPVDLVPVMRSASVAAVEVADRIVDLVEAGPAGRVRDLAGPQDLRMVDMVRAYARSTGRGGRVVAVPLPGVSAARCATGPSCPDRTPTAGRRRSPSGSPGSADGDRPERRNPGEQVLAGVRSWRGSGQRVPALAYSDTASMFEESMNAGPVSTASPPPIVLAFVRYSHSESIAS